VICLLCVLSRIHTLFPEHQAQLGPCDCRLLSIGCQRPLITTAHQLHSFRYKPGLCICCKSHHTCLSQLVRLHSVKPSFLADQLSPQPKQLCHIKGALLAGSYIQQPHIRNNVPAALHSLLQIKLLRILGQLGVSDKQASDNMYAVVADSMRRGNTGHTIGNAIVYEAVRTIANIYPNPTLLQSGTVRHSCHRACNCDDAAVCCSSDPVSQLVLHQCLFLLHQCLSVQLPPST